MRVFRKIINILVAMLLILRFPKDKAEANNLPVEENKYGLVLLSLDKKTNSIIPIEKKIVNSQVAIVKGNDLYSITRACCEIV